MSVDDIELRTHTAAEPAAAPAAGTGTRRCWG